MICANYNASGQVTVVTPPPADLSTCALLIQTPGDSLNNPFMLSASDGYAIATAVVSVWCVGFAFRAIIRSL